MADAGSPGAVPLDAGPGSSEPQPTVSYARDVQPIWDAHCTQCHSGRFAVLDLSAPGSHGRLLQAPPNFCLNEAGESFELNQVHPRDPYSSRLWIKLNTDLLVPTYPNCGREMPANGTGLAFSHPELAETIRIWIFEGALDN